MGLNFKQFQSKTYTSSNGVKHEIKTLPTPYIENIIKKLDREYDSDSLPEVYNDLTAEITLRKIRNTSEGMWVTGEGKVLKIESLETDHIENILNGWADKEKTEKYFELKIELLRREA